MQPILIAGPTASGKSALAMTLARRLGGVVINADSQQVYREWRLLTARPSPEDEADVPHRLYGHVSVAGAYSLGRWLDDVRVVLAGPAGTGPTIGAGRRRHGGGRPCAPARAGRARHTSTARNDGGPGGVPIVVGGTGLYFRALTQGLAPVPEVPTEVRAAGEAALAQLGLPGLAADLARRDPTTAGRLDPGNPRRVLRAWEVLEATGRGLASWQAETAPPLVPLTGCRAVALVPSRSALYAACDARLDAMIAAGALDEVSRVMAMDLPQDVPGLKAVGAAELAAHLRGETTLEEATAWAKAATRRYAKRQMTWIRNQMRDWPAARTPDAALPMLVDK